MRKRPLSKQLLIELKAAYASGKDAVLRFAREHKNELIAAGIILPIAATAIAAAHAGISDIKDITGLTAEDIRAKRYKSRNMSKMSKADLEKTVKGAPIIYSILGKKKKMMEEVSKMSPEFVEKADIRGVKFTINPFRLKAVERLGGQRNLAGVYSPMSRNIIIKPRIPKGGLTHEVYHGYHTKKNYPEEVNEDALRAAERIDKIKREGKFHEFIKNKFERDEPPAYFAGQVARKRTGLELNKDWPEIYKKLSLSQKKRIIREMYG